MVEVNYAFIQDNQVVNIVVFEHPTDSQLLAYFQNKFSLDSIILATEKAVVGGTYDGSKFWLPQPYPSWIKNEETNEWEAPIAYPNDGENYIWDENTTSWLLLPPSN